MSASTRPNFESRVCRRASSSAVMVLAPAMRAHPNVGSSLGRPGRGGAADSSRAGLSPFALLGFRVLPELLLVGALISIGRVRGPAPPASARGLLLGCEMELGKVRLAPLQVPAVSDLGVAERVLERLAMDERVP